MANWYGLGRTNYVRVRDRAALDSWIEQIGVSVEIFEKGDLIALSGYESDDGDLPSWYEDEDGEEHDDFLGEFVADHLHPEDVLVYMSCGAEKARYASGHASAYMVGKPIVFINLDDIYGIAAKAFEVPAGSITQATY